MYQNLERDTGVKLFKVEKYRICVHIILGDIYPDMLDSKLISMNLSSC